MDLVCSHCYMFIAKMYFKLVKIEVPLFVSLCLDPCDISIIIVYDIICEKVGDVALFSLNLCIF